MTRKNAIAKYLELNINEINELIAQKNPHIDFSDKITPYDGDKDWEELCSQMWWGRGYTDEIEEQCKPVLALKQRLLDIGGCEACLPAYEDDLDNILKHGQLWDNITQKMMRGAPSQCHRNSCELWYNNRKSCEKGFAVIICTGYALSKDGFWRQHSWLVQAKPRANVVIETTEPRVAYYGFGMTYDMAKEFEWNSL